MSAGRSGLAAAVAMLAVAGVVLAPGGATAAGAPARPVAPATYDCAFTVSGLGAPVSATLPVPVTVSLPQAPMRDGTAVPAGSAPVTATLDLGALTDVEGLGVANAIVQLIGFDGVLGGSVALDAAHPLSIGSVPATSALTAAPVTLDDLLSGGTITATGSLDAFTPRGAGTEGVTLPAAFDLVLSGTSGASVGTLLPVTFDPVTCTSVTGGPARVGSVSVLGAGTTRASVSSRLRVVGPRHARRGKPVAFRASLPGGSGLVVARVGRRTVGQAVLANGTARLTVRGLRPGTQHIRFASGPTQAAATVRVR